PRLPVPCRTILRFRVVRPRVLRRRAGRYLETRVRVFRRPAAGGGPHRGGRRYRGRGGGWGVRGGGPGSAPGARSGAAPPRAAAATRPAIPPSRQRFRPRTALLPRWRPAARPALRASAFRPRACDFAPGRVRDLDLAAGVRAPAQPRPCWGPGAPSGRWVVRPGGAAGAPARGWEPAR